jgi:hypothetical protein
MHDDDQTIREDFERAQAYMRQQRAVRGTDPPWQECEDYA